MSQSLLRQVCVRSYYTSYGKPYVVSIPSSSGLRSFHALGGSVESVLSQSLLRQVCVRSEEAAAWKMVEASQSLLRQVCVRSPLLPRMDNRSRLNPFFVRSAFVHMTFAIQVNSARSQSLLRQVCVRSLPLDYIGSHASPVERTGHKV